MIVSILKKIVGVMIEKSAKSFRQIATTLTFPWEYSKDLQMEFSGVLLSNFPMPSQKISFLVKAGCGNFDLTSKTETELTQVIPDAHLTKKAFYW